MMQIHKKRLITIKFLKHMMKIQMLNFFTKQEINV